MSTKTRTIKIKKGISGAPAIGPLGKPDLTIHGKKQATPTTRKDRN